MTRDSSDADCWLDINCDSSLLLSFTLGEGKLQRSLSLAFLEFQNVNLFGNRITLVIVSESKD